MDYATKLKDPRWQRKRLEILSRDNFSCVECGDKTSTLHVHHLKYKGNPWDIDNKYLKTLCEQCHKSQHEPKKKKKSALQKPPFSIDLDDLLQLTSNDFCTEKYPIKAIVAWHFKKLIEVIRLQKTGGKNEISHKVSIEHQIQYYVEQISIFCDQDNLIVTSNGKPFVKPWTYGK